MSKSWSEDLDLARRIAAGDEGALTGLVDELYAPLRRVAADADWRARAGEVGRARVARDYSIQSRARRIEDMITDLVARAAERPAR